MIVTRCKEEHGKRNDIDLCCYKAVVVRNWCKGTLKKHKYVNI